MDGMKLSEHKNLFCPHCREDSEDNIFSVLSTEMILNDSEYLELRGPSGTLRFYSYTCPKCGYTEWYRREAGEV